MPIQEPYSSPFILELDMTENTGDQDLDLLATSPQYISSQSPADLFGSGIGGEIKSGLDLGPTLDANTQEFCAQMSSFEQSPPNNSASPDDSLQDSASDSSLYKRKSSSESSRSSTTNKDVSMVDPHTPEWTFGDTPMAQDQSCFGQFSPGTVASSIAPSYEFSDKIMENDFDFESAASSPSQFTPQSQAVKSPNMPMIRSDTTQRSCKARGSVRHQHNKSSHSITKSMNGLTTSAASREASPLSTMFSSHDSSPTMLLNNSPPQPGAVEYINGQMLNGAPQPNLWSSAYDFGMNAPKEAMPFFPGNVPIPQAPLAMNFMPDLASMAQNFRPVLTIHPTPLKSRVETQIPIKMTLFPLPPGVTKLHLPTHTISKPKLLAKPSAVKAPDMLELTTTLVCTSAMQNPEFRRKAFARAAAGADSAAEVAQKEKSADEKTDEDDEDKPINGGEVTICAGCITRERKRAARKKVKKVEEEESWHKDEERRVIVFNTHEVKDWQLPSSQVQSDAVGDRPEPHVPEGAMQVDAPMRIACYCRHQNEKLGFQVIFTIKDWTGRLVAQEISSSIMITDDHKTHAIPQQLGQPNTLENGTFAPQQPMFGQNMGHEMALPPYGAPQFADMSTLQGMAQQPFPQSAVPVATPGPSSNRSLSRQASPSSSLGPSTKKRKASGSVKVPSGLAMTRLETGQPTPDLSGFANANQQAYPTPVSTYNLALSAAYSQQQVQNNGMAFDTGPPTPNSNDQVFFSNSNRSQSMDNLAMQHRFSAPASGQASRAPSPNGLRNGAQAYQQQQAQMAQAVASGLYPMQMSLNPPSRPIIHKMIPSEGPKAGGIEVTCLGSGFTQGLEVMFGDVKATTTTYWGETSLVCLLPPATMAGTVPVTFKHQHSSQLQPYAAAALPKSQTFFKYIDDDEQQIIRTALSVLGHKMTGRMEDVRDLARRIVGDGPSSWGAPPGAGGSSGGGQPPVSGFNAATFGVNVEATLLRILDFIDLDDSQFAPRLNLRRASGQTLLHLACSLGLQRFVAALLARGANPEPRDKGGFTPMHFAALHNHPQIVRRLMLSGADPSWRTLSGLTPADLTTSEEVLQATTRIENNGRRRSVGSGRSRTSSLMSLRSLWEPSTSDTLAGAAGSLDAIPDADVTSVSDEAAIDQDSDSDGSTDNDVWLNMASRKHSRTASGLLPGQEKDLVVAADDPGPVAVGIPAATVGAIRDHMAAYLHTLQQHFNLGNLPNLPNLPDYQAYLPTTPMVRRISSLVPHMGANRPANADASPKETDSKWWDLFSGLSTSSPPAYEDIYPHEPAAVDVKNASAKQAAVEAIADEKCAAAFGEQIATTQASGSFASSSVMKQDHQLMEELDEEEDVVPVVSAAKIRFRSDRKLFFIWIPLLIVIIASILYNRLPQLVSEATHLLNSLNQMRQQRSLVF